MIKAIIYESHTGFTKQYAYSFATSTGLPIYTIKEAKKKLNKGDNIIYFSWIKADKIYKINKVKKYNISYAAAVGMRLYDEELIENIKKRSKYENIYYLVGGIRWRMLGPFQRLMMKFILLMLKHEKKKNTISENDKVVLERMNTGYERVDLDSLKYLIDWYNNQKELVA